MAKLQRKVSFYDTYWSEMLIIPPPLMSTYYWTDTETTGRWVVEENKKLYLECITSTKHRFFRKDKVETKWIHEDKLRLHEPFLRIINTCGGEDY